MCDDMSLLIKFFFLFFSKYDITTCIINVKIFESNWGKCFAAVDEILRIWHKRRSSRWLKLGGYWVSVKELVLWWVFSVVDCIISCVLSQPRSIRFPNCHRGAAVNTEKTGKTQLQRRAVFQFKIGVILLFHSSAWALKLQRPLVRTVNSSFTGKLAQSSTWTINRSCTLTLCHFKSSGTLRPNNNTMNHQTSLIFSQ